MVIRIGEISYMGIGIRDITFTPKSIQYPVSGEGKTIEDAKRRCIANGIMKYGISFDSVGYDTLILKPGLLIHKVVIKGRGYVKT